MKRKKSSREITDEIIRKCNAVAPDPVLTAVTERVGLTFLVVIVLGSVGLAALLHPACVIVGLGVAFIAAVYRHKVTL